ncbi:hypothetical protein ACHWQZ_G004606 [Mnemiopsis leidyi]
MLEEDDDGYPMPEVLKLSQKPNELPHYGQFKHFIPDDFTEETVRTARALYGSVLKEVTTNREKHIFRGVLRVEERAVFCGSRKAKGNAFHNMGVQSKEGFRFQPEEALIQFEYGVLEIFLSEDSKVPMCLQDLYDIMLPWISLEFYQTYCHLVRLGYIVNRTDEFVNSVDCKSQQDNSTSLENVTSLENMTSLSTNSIKHRILTVRKPLSTKTDFQVVVLESSRTFPSLVSILDTIRSVGRTSVKIATVTDGKVYFYSLAMVEFPDADEIL